MQEEEPSVSEILSSIRQVLSKEAEALNSSKTFEEPLFVEQSVSSPRLEQRNTSGLQDFVVELTPQMRISNESLLSAETSLKTQAAFERLHQFKNDQPLKAQVDSELRPLLREWLNANLPAIVERVVTQEVRRIINK